MTVSMHEIAVGSLVPMLRTLSSLLEKGAADAATRKFSVDVLLGARLAPDMFDLRMNVQMACYNARELVHRLTTGDSEKPDLAPEDLPALQRRIAETIAHLEKVTASALEGTEKKKIEIAIPGDMVIAMTGLELLREWSLPQFYFHVTVVHAILRHNGVGIGIQDYGQAVGRHVRPRT